MQKIRTCQGREMEASESDIVSAAEVNDKKALSFVKMALGLIFLDAILAYLFWGVI
jgi:hypothetical protein